MSCIVSASVGPAAALGGGGTACWCDGVVGLAPCVCAGRAIAQNRGRSISAERIALTFMVVLRGTASSGIALFFGLLSGGARDPHLCQ